MKQENELANTLPGTPPVSKTTVTDQVPSVYETSGGETIDFHSAEFNRIDDVNDWSGNYRSFQPLDDVVTAHERHQMERVRYAGAIDPPADEATSLKKVEMERDGAAAVSLTVISKGRTLIIDTDVERAKACGKILSERQMACTLLVTKGTSAGISFPRLSSLAPLEVDGVSVTGAFGSFSATLNIKDGQKPLTKWLGDDAATFDLVLDLQSAPSFAGDSLPIGYYAPGPSPAALDEVMAELPEMRGRFKKPQFLSFLKTRCFHGRSRAHDCCQCMHVCPFGAIQSIRGEISIDHYLCQGCSGCALVCPADAIRLIQPSGQELLTSLQSRLGNLTSVAALPTTLVISDSESAGSKEPPATSNTHNGHRIHFEVEQIAHVRLEVLLAALAFGARDVLVACGPHNPPEIKKSAEWQVQMVRAILRGIGLSEDKCRFASIPPEDIDSTITDFRPNGLDAHTNNSPMMAPTVSPGQDRWRDRIYDKRALVRLATQHLYNQSGAQEPSLPLPDGSPFGAVVVNAAACTLCMACAGSCPSGALSASGDVPRLVFRESQCHQCGLCGKICPENAIQLLPRLLCDPEAVEAQRPLHEAQPLRCVECGVPFSSHAMINRIREKLTGHWMYANERQLRRLQMCRTCSARDALTSQEMKSWNLR
jgi:ferredoxin